MKKMKPNKVYKVFNFIKRSLNKFTQQADSTKEKVRNQEINLFKLQISKKNLKPMRKKNNQRKQLFKRGIWVVILQMKMMLSVNRINKIFIKLIIPHILLSLIKSNKNQQHHRKKYKFKKENNVLKICYVKTIFYKISLLIKVVALINVLNFQINPLLKVLIIQIVSQIKIFLMFVLI